MSLIGQKYITWDLNLSFFSDFNPAILIPYATVEEH